MDRLHPAEIASGIYWVGEGSQTKGLQCNPYLLIDGQEAVLIDPGSVLDFESVWENVCGLVSPDRIRYVILHHQDPDLASSVPLFEKKDADSSWSPTGAPARWCAITASPPNSISSIAMAISCGSIPAGSSVFCRPPTCISPERS